MWDEPLAAMDAAGTADEDQGLWGWLWSSYTPERAEFDWRSRVFTPYHFAQHRDALLATREAQNRSMEATEPPATCSCGSRAQLTPNGIEGRLECIHGATLALLHTWRCQDCGALLRHDFDAPETCTDCAADGGKDRSQDIVRTWAEGALAKARARNPAEEAPTP